MKSFKKLLSLVFVTILALVLVACGGGEPNADEVKLAEQADLLYLGKTDEVANDLKLPKYVLGNKEFAITWESSNTSVIEIKEYENEDKELYNLGSVNMASEVTTVTLTATITYKELSTTRSFEITVLADEYVGYENIAAVKAKEDKTKDVSKVKFNGTVSFTTKSGFGVTDGSASIYCYQSNHGRTVGEKVEVRGVWTYYNNMVQIASGCVVKSLGTDATFDIAKVAEAKTISEIFAIEAKTVDPENCTRIFKTTFAAKANAAGDYNAYRLVDPTDNSKYVDLSKYNDSETISYVGELAASGKFYEGIVIIYCSRSAGNGGLWDVLLVPSTVKEVEVKLSDAQIVAGILGDLNSAFNGKKVKENLTLPTEANGATITWASSNEDVISASGVYTAPKANTEVKLTATVKLNDETQTVELTVVAASKAVTVASLVTNPQAGVAYKLGIDQKELSQVLFATGAMSGYYGATITEHADSIDVYLEAVEGGYNLYTMVSGAKKYIIAEYTGTHKNFKYVDSPATPWTYNAEYNTIFTVVEGLELFIGTRGTYNTIGAYETNTIANSYPVHFYEEVEDKAYTNAPEVGVAYKLGMDQQTLEKLLYFTGAMSGYYGATSETYAEGIDVFFEANGEGYNVYFMLEGAKKYITAVVSEKDGKTYKNFTIADAADNVWVFNAEYSTVVTTVNGLELFMGTRGSYNTVSVYETKELADDYPVHFYTKDSNAGTVEPEPEPEPEPSVDEYVKELEVGKAYKLFMYQTSGSKNYFFVGTMNGYYGASSTTKAEGVDVFVEANGEGYNVYFMLEGAKKYITAVVSEKDGKTHRNFTISDAPSTVWTFDTTNHTLTCDLEGTKCFIGTYGTYNTFGVSTFDKLETSYPARFVLAEGGSVEPEPDPEPTPEVIDATVTEILAAAKDLADESVLEAKYTAKGTVTEVTDAYSEQYKNISFKLTDGTSVILCYRVKGEEAANVAAGDTITLTGEIKNYKGTIEFVNATIIAREAGNVTPEPEPDPEPSNADAEILFNDEAKRTEMSGEKQVWTNGSFVITNNKHESTQDVKDYFNPVRFYANTNLVFEFDKEFKTIVLYTVEKCYKGDEAIAGATLTVANGVMTIVLDTPAKSFTIEKLVSQIKVAKAQLFVGEATVEPEPEPDPEPSADPYAKSIEVGKAYKFFIEQKGLGKVLYFKGTMNGYYGATTEVFAEGVDVFFETNGDGYSLYFKDGDAKKYITVVRSESNGKKYNNFVIADSASTVWTFDTTNYTLTCELEGTTCYMGTYGTYNTFSVSPIDKLATSYPSRFVLASGGEVTPEPEPTPDPEPSTDLFVKEILLNGIYKFFIEQKGLGKVLYFKGTMNGYYGASTENKEEGVDVFFEANGDGYSLCFMQNGVKKYITVVRSESNGKKYNNFVIADAPSTVWTFDTTNYTLTCDLEGTKCYMGTYGTYNTFSVSTFDKLATSYPARFELVEVVEPEPEQPEIELPNDAYLGPIETPIPGFVVEYISKYATLEEALKDSENLENNAILFYEYIITGEVSSIKDAYSTQYKNISFYLSDGANELLCFRVKGDVASKVNVGDTLTLIGMIKNYNGTIEFVDATIIERKAAAGTLELAGVANLDGITTKENSGGDAKYTNTYTSPDGWKTVNSAIQVGGPSDANPAFKVVGASKAEKAVCLNGKKGAAGTLTSPTLTGGIAALKFNWAKMFTDTAINFSVIVTDLSTGTQYTKVIDWAGGKNENQKIANAVEFKLDAPISGDFTIQFVNNCPSNSTSNKDRATIMDIEWYK